MGFCYPLTLQKMQRTAINEATMTATKDLVTWMIFPPEVEIRLRTVLAPYGYEIDSDEAPDVHFFLSRIEDSCRSQFHRMPWAIVFYPKEYPLSGHFLSIRTNADDMRFSAYSLLRDRDLHFDPAIDGAPPFSFLWIFSKSALEETAKYNSPLLKDVWLTLADKSANSSWVAFPGALDSHWVDEVAKTNEELFFQHVEGR
jgi:hypothetical protein